MLKVLPYNVKTWYRSDTALLTDRAVWCQERGCCSHEWFWSVAGRDDHRSEMLSGPGRASLPDRGRGADRAGHGGKTSRLRPALSMYRSTASRKRCILLLASITLFRRDQPLNVATVPTTCSRVGPSG